MIQFNLLPDVKLQYIKARRTQHMMTLISLAVIAVSLVVFVLMFTTVNIVQKKSLSDLKDDIQTSSKKLKDTKDLNQILTIQNQLNTLGGLHNDKVVASRLFTFLSQVTPEKASLNKLNVDFTANTLTVSGKAPSLDVVNTLTDTLKATTYLTSKAKESDTPAKAFSSVVLSSFGRDSTGAIYTVTLNFDPIIFDNADDVTLTVPEGANADPLTLFQKQESN